MCTLLVVVATVQVQAGYDYLAPGGPIWTGPGSPDDQSSSASEANGNGRQYSLSGQSGAANEQNLSAEDMQASNLRQANGGLQNIDFRQSQPRSQRQSQSQQQGMNGGPSRRRLLGLADPRRHRGCRMHDVSPMMDNDQQQQGQQMNSQSGRQLLGRSSMARGRNAPMSQAVDNMV